MKGWATNHLYLNSLYNPRPRFPGPRGRDTLWERRLFNALLINTCHGVCFSAYLTSRPPYPPSRHVTRGQGPGEPHADLSRMSACAFEMGSLTIELENEFPEARRDPRRYSLLCFLTSGHWVHSLVSGWLIFIRFPACSGCCCCCCLRYSNPTLTPYH